MFSCIDYFAVLPPEISLPRICTFINSPQNGETGGRFLPSVHRDRGLAGRPLQEHVVDRCRVSSVKNQARAGCDDLMNLCSEESVRSSVESTYVKNFNIDRSTASEVYSLVDVPCVREVGSLNSEKWYLNILSTIFVEPLDIRRVDRCVSVSIGWQIE